MRLPLMTCALVSMITVSSSNVDVRGQDVAFDAASVKPDVSGNPANTNVGLSGLDEEQPNGGYLSATGFRLSTYIGFAYKLAPNQLRLVELPAWATTARYDIEARAGGSPTRDHMRLMMRSLLADRFKLSAHFETQQRPVYALVLDKPTQTGPQLTRFTGDPPCPGAIPAGTPLPSSPGPSGRSPSWPPPICGALIVTPPGVVPGRVRVAARNLTPEQIATFLLAAPNTTLDRPIIDQTALDGRFDFHAEYAPEFTGPVPGNFEPDPLAPRFTDALREQLGLQLKVTTGGIEVLVIDHIEPPTPD